MLRHAQNHSLPQHLLYITKTGKCVSLTTTITEAVPYLYIFPEKAFSASSRGPKSFACHTRGPVPGAILSSLGKELMMWSWPYMLFYMISLEPISQVCPHDWRRSHIQHYIANVVFHLLVDFNIPRGKDWSSLWKNSKFYLISFLRKG